MGKVVKKSFLFIVASMMLILSACNSSDKTNAKDSGGKSDGPVEAKFGVISFITGSGAAYGEAITNGFNLALDEVNAEGKVKIELAVEDSAGKQEQALSAAQKLMADDSIIGLLGPTLSTEMNVVAPEADLTGVPIMGTSTTADGIPQIGDYVFRNSIPEALAIPASIDKAIEKYGVKKVAILYGNDDVFTKSGYDTMKKQAEKKELEIVASETFQRGQSDYNAILTKIKKAKPDLILCSALYNEGAVIMDQARKMGIDAPFVGGNGFNSPEIITIAGKAADGLIVATPWFGAKEDVKVQEFNKKYKNEYGKEPDQFAAQAYDAMKIYAKALEEAGVADRDAFRDALAQTKDFDGILGNFSFDEEGDVVMNPTVLIIKDGTFQLFE
ncbi:MAG: ABC transporter substrate-binding protein [Bacillus sp. (in: firmicutes)]